MPEQAADDKQAEKTKRKHKASGPLSGEIQTMRAVMKVVKSSVPGVEEERVPKLASAAARLSDSIGRALLVEQKLAESGGEQAWLRAQFDRVLREMGLGEEA